MPTSRFVTLSVFAVVLVYAIVRYVIVGAIAPAQVPVFILNKAFAVSGLAMIAAALVVGPLVRMRVIGAAWMTHRKAFGIHGFALASVHALLSIATLSPVRYAKLHDRVGTLTFEGGLVVLGGVLAFAALVVPAITSAAVVRTSMTVDAWRRAQRLGIVALAIGIAHVGILGWRSWLVPATWPAGLPPLTIIAVVIGALAFAIRGAARLRRPRTTTGASPVRA